MPVSDNPHPDAPEDTYLSLPQDDIMAQVIEATYSPSPLLRVLQDPTLMPMESSDNLKDKSTRKHSHSPGRRREHRSPMVAAIAIAEEERHGKHLKSLLRQVTEYLEQEKRRAADATMKLEFAERREREALSRAIAAEAKIGELKHKATRLESDVRGYQMHVEALELAEQRLREDLSEARRQIHDTERGERRVQEKLQRYQFVLQDYEREQGSRMQEAVNNAYEDGREDGYDEGYDVGYEDGRKQGIQEGIKTGRTEGLQENKLMSMSRDQGHRKERHNAVPQGTLDDVVAEDSNDPEQTYRLQQERTRQWAKGISKDDGRSEVQMTDVEVDHV